MSSGYVIITALLVLSACGSEGGETLVGAGSNDGGSEVTVAGADSSFVDEGADQAGSDDGAGPTVVSIKVDVPPDADLAGIAIVTLEDVSYSDVESVEIIRIELPVEDLRSQDDTVELLLPLPLDGSVDVTATAHIDVDESGSFAQGDWISNELALVTPESAAGIVLRMVRI